MGCSELGRMRAQGSVQGQAEGVAWRELQKARTDWVLFPFPQLPPSSGSRLQPCLLNREAWQKWKQDWRSRRKDGDEEEGKVKRKILGDGEGKEKGREGVTTWRGTAHVPSVSGNTFGAASVALEAPVRGILLFSRHLPLTPCQLLNLVTLWESSNPSMASWQGKDEGRYTEATGSRNLSWQLLCSSSSN